jgi:hypothetical protein
MANVLHLVIYNDNSQYRDMLDAQKSNVNREHGIDTFFVLATPGQETDVNVDRDFVFVNGEEHLMGITNKTLKAAYHLLSLRHYDFVLRTNISTIVNFKRFRQYVDGLPRENVYTGGVIHTLTNGLLPWAGSYDDSLYGVNYVEGTSIVFSRDVIWDMCKTPYTLRHDIIDDVSFGDWVRKYKPQCLEGIWRFRTNQARITEEWFPDDKRSAEIRAHTFVRNRVHEFQSRIPGSEDMNRSIDIVNMRRILETLREFN